jgi:hypothetical protein
LLELSKILVRGRSVSPPPSEWLVGAVTH